MWDDQQDKQVMRSQTIGIVLIMVLFLGWMKFFPPAVVERPVNPTSNTQSTPGPNGAAIPGTQTTQPAIADAWPYLPPVPIQTNPADDEFTISNGHLDLVFTRIGGRLKRADLILGENGDDTFQLIPEPALDPNGEPQPDTATVYPLGLEFKDEELGDALNYRRFEAKVDQYQKAVTFTLKLENAAVVTKTFRFTDRRNVLDMEVTYENLEEGTRSLGLDATPAYTMTWGPNLHAIDESNQYPPRMVWRQRDASKAEFLQAKKLPEENGVPVVKRFYGLDWLGYKSKYVMVAFRPKTESAAEGWVQGSAENLRFGLTVPQFTLQPNAPPHRAGVELYLGPMHLGALNQAWDTLPESLRFFESVDIMDWFAKLLLRNLNWWYSIFNSYGVAIIMLTVLVRMAMLPLMLKSMRSMKRMQLLAPELKELQEKYKDDQQELSKAMMSFYRERGVNPLSGCFPMLLQLPVFITLYRMLWDAYEIRGASFLWIEDLTQPDKLFHLPFVTDIPFIGPYFNLLPILSGIAMLLSMKFTPTSGPAINPQQKMMMRIMPILMTVMFYTFASGLNLYVLTSTVIGILQQQLVRAVDVKPPEKIEKKEVRKGKNKNFYARAKERQRQMNKRDKKRKKSKR